MLMPLPSAENNHEPAYSHEKAGMVGTMLTGNGEFANKKISLGQNDLCVKDLSVSATSEVVSPLVLLVDDDSDLCSMLCLFLKTRCHCLVVAAQSGYEALTLAQKLRAQKQTPDLVLLDWVLPDIPGYEVARQMRKDSALIAMPIVIISEHCWNWQIQQQAEVAGCQECIDKSQMLSKLPTLVAHYTTK